MGEIVRTYAAELVGLVNEMSPYLLLGFLFAGILRVIFPRQLINRYMGQDNFRSVFNASLLGVPMPLCSCGVIPVSMSLRKHGASKGATVSFLLSTPQTGVDSIFVTYSLLGPVFAVFRPLAALVTGLVGGALVNVFGQKAGSDAEPANCADECCAAAPVGQKIVVSPQRV